MEAGSLRNYFLSILITAGCATLLIKDSLGTESLEEVLKSNYTLDMEQIMDKNYFSATEHRGKLEKSFLNYSLSSGSTTISSEYNFDEDSFPEVIAYFPVKDSQGKLKVTDDFAKLIIVDYNGDNKYDLVREATNKKGIFDFNWNYGDWIRFQENPKIYLETKSI